MENQKKCFSEEHKGINAIIFCPECRIYMCNKCENLHSSLFKNHNTLKVNKDIDILFTGFCNEKNHPNKLEYFCKNHNQLCCSTCIAKLNKKGDGQHKDCNVCEIENIKEEKKNKLKENIKFLEDIENKFNENMKELKGFFEKIEKNKEDLKIKVQNIFTKIRNTLNDREVQLLLEIDNIYNDKYFDESIIKKGEKFPKQIKLSLEKGKLIDKEWDNNNLYSYINDCINIENNIKKINMINENVKKIQNSPKIKVEFIPKEDDLNIFLKTLNSFGKVYLDSNIKFKECPNFINNNKAYSLCEGKKNIITKTGSNGWMGAICENELNKSIEEHKWKIKILKSEKKYVMVGVAPIDFDINISTHHNCGWYLFCSDSSLHSGPPYKYCGKNINLSTVKDEVVIVMNMKKRALKFIINNEDKGDSYTNIPIDKPIFPAVFLYEKNDSVEISEI